MLYHDINRCMKRGLLFVGLRSPPTITGVFTFERRPASSERAFVSLAWPADPRLDHHRPTARTSQDKRKKGMSCAARAVGNEKKKSNYVTGHCINATVVTSVEPLSARTALSYC